MLIAYGYAREPRSVSAGTTDTQVATDDEALVAEEENR